MAYGPVEVARTDHRVPAFFVTGFPGFIGKQLVTRLSRQFPDSPLTVLVEPSRVTEAVPLLARLEGEQRELVSGDVSAMHLGLSGREYQAIAERTTHVFHLAASSSLMAQRSTLERINVQGTANVLELARDCGRLRRLVHFSTCAVSGTREGIIAEDELDMDQSFRNPYEETKFRAEGLVERAKGRLPLTIVRPATVVGDSVSGATDRFEGPYALGMALLLSPLVVPLPLPLDGAAPLNVVPVDFVVDAAVALAMDPHATGATVHLVDPHPMSARRVYEHIAARANRRLPRFTVPARAAELVMRLPGVERLTRSQRSALALVSHLAVYASPVAQSLLEPAGVRCPPLTSYLDVLIDYAMKVLKERRAELPTSGPPDDPLDA